MDPKRAGKFVCIIHGRECDRDAKRRHIFRWVLAK
jgi:hypothetical protein